MLKYCFAKLVICFCVLISVEANANLIANGSFEQPEGTAWISLPSNSTVISNWKTTANGVEWFNAIPWGGARDGVMAIDLANYVYTNGGIEQIFSTNVGKNYVLNFSLGTHSYAGRDGTAEIDVGLNGQTTHFNVANPLGNIKWFDQSLIFTATSAYTTLSFFNAQSPYMHFAYVDAVSVIEANQTSVPEPSAFVLILIGFMIFFGKTVKRRFS